MAHTRPFLITGVALASAAAIAVVPSVVTVGAPTPTALSTASYELTALTDVTIEGITGALIDGWGGFIGPDDVFYPATFNNDVKLTGVNGVAYYLADQVLDGIAPYNLENYFFEVGSRDPSNAVLAGLGAVAYVGVGSAFGVDSVPAQLVKAITTGSFDLSSINIGNILGNIDLANLAPAVLALTAGIPVIGPVASVYLTGMAPGDDTVYGTGLAGVAAYAGTALPGISNLLNAIGGGGVESDDEADDEADDEDENDDADEIDDETDDEGKSGKSGKSDWKAKSAAAVAVVSETVVSKTAVSETVADIDAPSVALNESADTAPAVKVPHVGEQQAGSSDIAASSGNADASDMPAKPAAPKRGIHRGGTADKGDAPDRTAKRTATRSSRSN
jgi:hypothetical protein